MMPSENLDEHATNKVAAIPRPYSPIVIYYAHNAHITTSKLVLEINTVMVAFCPV